jgi:hypothetical protein
MTTTLLYRPIGAQELALIEASGWRAFPPRLHEQPVFNPVTNEAYAHQIARDWNAKHNFDGLGFVTRFAVRSDFLAACERKVAEASGHEEYWIPVDALEAFNDAIDGSIEIIAGYTGVHGGSVDIKEFLER